MTLRQLITGLADRNHRLTDLIFVKLESRDGEPVTVPITRVDGVGNICLDRQAVVNAMARQGDE